MAVTIRRVEYLIKTQRATLGVSLGSRFQNEAASIVDLADFCVPRPYLSAHIHEFWLSYEEADLSWWREICRIKILWKSGALRRREVALPPPSGFPL
jgi:hypothetical protein